MLPVFQLLMMQGHWLEMAGTLSFIPGLGRRPDDRPSSLAVVILILS